MSVKRNLMGPRPAGVPSPLSVHVHPYPTRYHGTFATRPVFGFPRIAQPHAVFKPNDFYSFYQAANGLGSSALGYSGAMVYSGWTNTRVVTLQKQINALLRPKYLPLKEDGVIGRATCGALKMLGSAIQTVEAAEARKVCAASKVTYVMPTLDSSYVAPTTVQTAATPVQTTTVTATSPTFVLYGKSDPRVVAVQTEVNGNLVPQYLPIKADGIIGPATCGAVHWASGGSNGPSLLTNANAPAVLYACAKANVRYTAPRPNPAYVEPAQIVDVPASPHVSTESVTEAPAPSKVIVPSPGQVEAAAAMTPDAQAAQSPQQQVTPKAGMTNGQKMVIAATLAAMATAVLVYKTKTAKARR